MKTLYFDCGMGAAGDMMTAALLELLPEEEQEELLAALRGAGLEGVEIRKETVTKCGIAGTHISVAINGTVETADDGSTHTQDHTHEHIHEHEAGHGKDEGHEHDSSEHHNHHHHHHHHMHMSDIEEIVEKLAIPEDVKKDVLAVYSVIAGAESHVHGVETAEVHFHEVGMKDAIMDVTAVCMLMRHIAPDRIIASPVHVGSGQVKCAHGIMPVPAPATAYILRGVPIYSNGMEGELCTPTGAALLRHFVQEYGPMPVMAADAVGYGMGMKDFPRANCLRVTLGESAGGGAGGTDRILELSCNLDDITGEEIGFAEERLYELGAKEVYTIPIGMKKSRPGIILNVFCDPKDREDMLRAIFRYTSTIGIRETEHTRYILKREERVMETSYGNIRYKHSEGYGVCRDKPEFEDIARIAGETGSSLRELKIPSLQEKK